MGQPGVDVRPPEKDGDAFAHGKGLAQMKKLIVLVAIVALAAFAFSKLTAGSKEEREFGA
jgi:hypothetical protein